MPADPRKPLRRIAFAVVSLLLVPALLHAQEQTVADQEEWSAVQKEVWEQEKKYWRLRDSLDVEGFMSLWDEDFVGWSGPGIISRESVRKMSLKAAKSRRPGALNYELIPRAVRVNGDVGITFYTAIFKDSTGVETAEVRFHHTWRKEDGQWKIIEGLSAAPLDQQEQMIERTHRMEYAGLVNTRAVWRSVDSGCEFSYSRQLRADERENLGLPEEEPEVDFPGDWERVED